MAKSKKKRRDSEAKLGYGVIYDYDPPLNNRKKRKASDAVAIEDKDWQDITGMDVRKLLLQGWKTNTFLSSA